MPLVGDEIAELAETFSVTLSNPLRAPLAQTTAEASISDADLPIITVVAADAEAAEGVIESGEFRFSLLGETDEVVSVNVGFSGAADNTDDVFYTQRPGRHPAWHDRHPRICRRPDGVVVVRGRAR